MTGRGRREWTLLKIAAVVAAIVGASLFLLGAVDVWMSVEGACPSWVWPGYLWRPAAVVLGPFERIPIVARHWFGATMMLNALIYGAPIAVAWMCVVIGGREPRRAGHPAPRGET